MKNKKPNLPAAGAESNTNWLPLGAILAGAILLFWAYAPSLHGSFVFDDTKQQYALPTATDPLAVVDRPRASHPHVHLLG